MARPNNSTRVRSITTRALIPLFLAVLGIIEVFMNGSLLKSTIQRQQQQQQQQQPFPPVLTTFSSSAADGILKNITTSMKKYENSSSPSNNSRSKHDNDKSDVVELKNETKSLTNDDDEHKSSTTTSNNPNDDQNSNPILTTDHHNSTKLNDETPNVELKNETLSLIKDDDDDEDTSSTTTSSNPNDHQNPNSILTTDNHNSTKLNDETPNYSSYNNYKHETNVFRHMMERSIASQQVCSNKPNEKLPEKSNKDFDTGVPRLPINGLQSTLFDWLDRDDGDDNEKSYETCSLPPPKLCNVTSYSVILMAHTISDRKRLGKLIGGIEHIADFSSTAEIILVWNNDKSVLTESNDSAVKQLLSWEEDDDFPLRIFYSYEHGLENNLLNRYHPLIKPTQEAVVYFDDDGPFFSENAMDVGFKLWQLNSDTQVGAMPRNIRFISKRMIDLHTKAIHQSVSLYSNNNNAWQTQFNPQDKESLENEKASHSNNMDDVTSFPEFIPFCGGNNDTTTAERVEYNYFVFPHFSAHMVLPSGSIIHRNFLCFIWHPVFQELRQYILDHPTHPDDMSVSTIITHLSGKSVRTYPRFSDNDPSLLQRGNEDEPTDVNEKDDVNDKRRILSDEIITSSSSSVDHIYNESSHTTTTRTNLRKNEQRRKLLWQQENWADMREEAINSILGYFGSINPGSVGWCVGTDRQVKKGKMIYECSVEFPFYEQVPWIENNQCLDS